MSYTPDTWTDKELEALERRISQVYTEAERELQQEVNEYFAKFKLRDKEMQALVDAGEMSKAEYQRWRLTQIGRGKRFEALRDKMAERYTQANEVANAYVNDITPSIYSLNRNYEAYTIETAVGNCDFTLWDESTVRRLIVEEPDLMPYYPPDRALKRGLDLAYGKQQITSRVTSGILRGLAPSKIASELMNGITAMNRESAVRAARTGVTAAQNGGRMDSYVAAEKMGIKIKRRWMCTKDSRTRLAHGMADGQIVEGTKTPFVVGGEKMMFPGDKSMGAHGWNLYNCRCTTRTVEKDGIEAEPRQMRVRDPVTGENVLVNEMTYSEWAEWKKTGVQPVTKYTPKKTAAMKRDPAKFRQQTGQEVIAAEPKAYTKSSTMEKAEEFARSLTKDGKFYVDGLHLNTVNAFNEAMFNVEQRLGRKLNIAGLKQVKKADAAYMQGGFSPTTRFISLKGGNSANALASFAKHREKYFANGWLSSADPFGTFYHEIGHAVWYDLPTVARTEITEIYKKEKHEAFLQWKDMGGSSSGISQTEVFGKKLSRYAHTDEHEFFSEAFSQIFSGRMHPVSRKVKSVLDKYYK